MVDVDDHYEKMHFILMVVVEKTVGIDMIN